MSADRRRHRVFFTRHTEYHLRGDECVGVRDRVSGTWLSDHAALRLRALRLPSVLRSDEWIGQRIQFWGSRTDVLTSPVVAVDRPGIDQIGAYVSQARVGEFRARAGSADLQRSLPA